jgi:hypothetical protein
MYDTLKNDVQAELDHIRESNLYKEERVILSDQKPGITVGIAAAGSVELLRQ